MSDSREEAPLTGDDRLIEHAFPLKQASLDSVHEKNVRHGHISTLHIWPARRPLAACRAALIATLLPDPGTPEARNKLVEKIGGTVVKKIERKKVGGKTVEVERKETLGGVLHWGRESVPAMDEFREEIRKAYGGRAPKVLDPFAGGGAIPLEAMRLGCEVTAIDINPVAWFILKCTLEYPQKLAGQHRPLPQFALESPEFMEAFFKGTGKLTKGQLARNLEAVQSRLFPAHDVDLAWHVRAWGGWVLQRVREELGAVYKEPDGKTPAAYLWARTVICKNCRIRIPLLKTCWLFKIDEKRVLLTVTPTDARDGVVFGVQYDVPRDGGNAAQRREHDKRIGRGTVSASGVWCPCCQAITSREDIQHEGLNGRLGTMLVAIAVEGEGGKLYRLATPEDAANVSAAEARLDAVFETIPFGIPRERITQDAKGSTWCVQYGFDSFDKLFTPRQLLAVGTLIRHIRAAREALSGDGYSSDWIEAIQSYLACALSRWIDFGNMGAQWKLDRATINHSFARFALPLSWDFAEANPFSSSAGGFALCYERIAAAVDTYGHWRLDEEPRLVRGSAIAAESGGVDVVLTDPPYYDAIAYAAIMDFFYVWLRRVLNGLSAGIDHEFRSELSPKWNSEAADGELIDDANRFGGDKEESKRTYEDGMFRAFQAAAKCLNPEGRLAVVFANKQPNAWEALVSALIRAGFITNGSWPIQTEQASRMRALSSAALSSSVWLVCKRRQEGARQGWDSQVIAEMRANIYDQLREFWDAGITGPDFVWAATGPALEAYSKHPVVRKANEPGRVMEVSEFLGAVRRIVVDFVVGRVLSLNGGGQTETGLDDVTTYYLLHRNDFKLDDAPIGACILYAVSCSLSDKNLADRYDILVRTGGQAGEESEEGEDAGPEEDDSETEEGTGSKVKLRPWHQRKRKNMGYDAEGAPAPMIDQVHRLMHLWKAGDLARVNEYVDSRALRRNALFHQLLQALIELAPAATEERSLLESISNHLASRGPVAEKVQMDLPA